MVIYKKVRHVKPNFFYALALLEMVFRFRYTAYPRHKSESSSATSHPSPIGVLLPVPPSSDVSGGGGPPLLGPAFLARVMYCFLANSSAEIPPWSCDATVETVPVATRMGAVE